MGLIIGIILMLGGASWGLYPYFVEDFSYNIQYYAQLAIAIGGGIYLVFYENFWTVSNWFMRMFDSKPSPITPDVKSTEDYTYKDYESLIYFKKRAKQLKNKEMEALVVKLNDLLFSASMEVDNE